MFEEFFEDGWSTCLLMSFHMFYFSVLLSLLLSYVMHLSKFTYQLAAIVDTEASISLDSA